VTDPAGMRRGESGEVVACAPVHAFGTPSGSTELLLEAGPCARFGGRTLSCGDPVSFEMARPGGRFGTQRCERSQPGPKARRTESNHGAEGATVSGDTFGPLFRTSSCSVIRFWVSLLDFVTGCTAVAGVVGHAQRDESTVAQDRRVGGPSAPGAPGSAEVAPDPTGGTLGQVDDQALLRELEPTAGTLFDRHVTGAKEWFPHEFVPWGRGDDFTPGEAFDESGSPLSPAVRSALLVNLLTEDNLPHYFANIQERFGRDGVWGAWSRRWTAEEGRHAIVIRDYLTVTRAIDLHQLERARMIQVSGGVVPEPAGIADGIVYVALQELATRIAHRNTGKLLDDEAGQAVMSRVAADENLHHLFYRDLASAAIAVDPSTVVEAIDRRVREFEMPGTGIPDFNTHAKLIAGAGIYDFASHHDQILVPVIFTHWKLEQLTGLTPAAEQARDRVVEYVERLGKMAARMRERATR